MSATAEGPARLEVRAIGRKGRGVFAAAPVRAGDLLEAAPTAELDRHDTDAITGTTLDTYYFAHPENPEGGLLVFGLTSLLNHADDPNTGTTPRHSPGLGWVLELRALRDIGAGEEVTRRYACELWFEPERPAG